MAAAGILGISYHLPDRVETNEQLRQENPDWRIEEIYKRSGIASRHIAAPDETASDLGYRAAVKLLDRSLAPIEEIDYLIYCTQCPDYALPPGACILQHRLKLGKHVGAFDYNLGCSGYVYGLQLAKSLVVSEAARNVLLIAADTYSKYIHPRDRSVRVLFGDGGSATLIGRTRGVGEIGRFVVGSDGAGAEKLIVRSGGLRMPRSAQTSQEVTDASGCTRSADNLYMDGPAVFAFAVSTVPPMLASLLAKSRLTFDEIDWFVYHQANRYMLDNLARRSNIPPEKMILDMEDVGNTVSASIPITIQRAVDRGTILSGHRLVLLGFGVGFSWGLCDVVWN